MKTCFIPNKSLPLQTKRQVYMTQLVLEIENPSALRAIKALVKNMVGVNVATTKRRKTGMDLALDDVKAGRITEYASVEDLISAAKR